MIISSLLIKLMVLAAVSAAPMSGIGVPGTGVAGTGVAGTGVAAAPPATSCPTPAQVLDLENWKVQVPIRDPNKEQGPLEVLQPVLSSYTAPWFETTVPCDGVTFRAPVDGVTTKNSRNPRSELREMTDGGTANAAWSSTAGTHTIVVNEAFVRLPLVKPDIVGVQIHDASDDISVFRLEGRNLYVTRGDDPHFKLITDKYTLGTRFEAKYVVHGGTVEAYYNGVLQTTISDRFKGAYFKAGAYPQANCTNSAPCNNTNYGETKIYSVAVTHQVTRWQLIWDWITDPLTLGVAALVLVAVAGFVLLRRRRTRRAG